jgi:hypothetical protein
MMVAEEVGEEEETDVEIQEEEAQEPWTPYNEKEEKERWRKRKNQVSSDLGQKEE